MGLISRIFISLLCTASCTSMSDTVIQPSTPDSTLPEKPQKKESAELISFNYSEEELVNVINFIATKKGVNLLLPTRSEDKITGKLTWQLDEKITIDKAWNLLQTIVSIAGYSMIPHPTYYEVMKTTPSISREAVPLYIGVPYEQLPTTDARIRYMYYLSNIKSTGEEGENEIITVLKSWLPSTAVFKIDSASNALIIMAQSNDIRAIMPIIASLDQPGFQEKMEIIPLRYTQARNIADLFNNKILQTYEVNRYRLDTKKQSEATFFSKHLKIVANERRNNLIVLGRAQAIDRTRNFIKNYMDVPQDSGKSILHTYKLQYLDAPSFAKVLENVLLQKQPGGLEQAAGARQKAVGPQRYFDEVIIATDTPDTAGFATGTAEGEETSREAKFYGGNTLIIACRSDDWKRIEALIGKLDQPSPQVLIEVLITDLTLDDSKKLGTALRNPEKIPMAGSTAYQSAHLAPGVMPETFDQTAIPNTIGLIEDQNGTVQAATDLLRRFREAESGVRSDGTEEDPANTSIAAQLQAGSTVLSFSDNSGKTWGITQILKVLDHSKILSHPHVISTSDKKAIIEISETRKLRDAASGSQGGTVVATRKDIEAKLLVEITPRISISEEKENAVNLQVKIDINQFKSASTTDDTRITRNVTTNVTVNTGDILALGGLIRSNEEDAESETPVLSKIPIIGWMFKKRSKTKQRTNLTVFISPTVILPRHRDDMHEYTKDYLDITRAWAKEGGMFDSLKDPITRWFFAGESPTEEFTKEFLKNDVRFQKTPMPQATIGPTKPIKLSSNQGKSSEDEKLIAQQSQEQHDQLKDLFKEIENPFKELKLDSLAQNEKPFQPQLVAQKAHLRRRRKK